MLWDLNSFGKLRCEFGNGRLSVGRDLKDFAADRLALAASTMAPTMSST